MISTSKNMDINEEKKPVISYINDEYLAKRGIHLGVLRLDEVHPVVSGNKWFKLKYNIEAAVKAGKKKILTFGGSHSNHLIATAAAARLYDLESIGMVRGLHAETNTSPTLKDCREEGMELYFLGRNEYKQKDEPGFIKQLQQKFPDACIIPEGGSNDNGRLGAGLIAEYIPGDAHLVMLAMGTGTTFEGVRLALSPSIAMAGFPVMKGGAYLYDKVCSVPGLSEQDFVLYDQYHFGGFARYDDELISFMNIFHLKHRIRLDFVYTAKMMYGIYDLIAQNKIEDGSHIIAIHTGGVQGNRSIRHRLGFSLDVDEK